MEKDNQHRQEEEKKPSSSQKIEGYEHHRFVADKGQEPIRVDKFLTNFIENTSRNRIQLAAKFGHVYVNEVPVKSNYKVKPGDVVQLIFNYPPYEHLLVPEDIPLDIVYEDSEVIVVNKPAGMVVHPGHGNYSGTLVNALLHHVENLPENSDERPGLVHRLDKNTSGIMVAAKTENAMTDLAMQFFKRTTDRLYYALVWGDVEQDEGTIEGHIARHEKNRLLMAVYPDGEQGKHAVTHYKVIERFRYVTLVQCKLETGRTHQIRVHFAHIGHPLFNDERYGGDKILKGTTFSKYKQFIENCFTLMPRHALHAKTLGFDHPTTKERLFFDSELPEDFRAVLEKWRRYTKAGSDTVND